MENGSQHLVAGEFSTYFWVNVTFVNTERDLVEQIGYPLEALRKNHQEGAWVEAAKEMN